MGIFSCCIGDKKQIRNESEARHARIVEIYAQATYESQESTRTPPPSYDQVVHENESPAMRTITEKEPYQPPAQMRLQHTSPTPSRRTSICSVPSTRLTDITSAHTGGTSVTVGRPRNDGSMRSSLVFDSAPPSYYDDRSIRERSRSPDGQRRSEEYQQHPVTTEDWLEVLRRTAQAAENHVRQLQRG